MRGLGLGLGFYQNEMEATVVPSTGSKIYGQTITIYGVSFTVYGF